MKNLLFPHQFQLIGWILFIPALVAGALICFGALPLTGIAESVVNDTVIISIALGALFIVCSKERNEDEIDQAGVASELAVCLCYTARCLHYRHKRHSVRLVLIY